LNSWKLVAIALGVFGCVACSGSSHPPGEASEGTTNAQPIVVTDDDVPCTAGTSRDCKHYYYDAQGGAHCPMSAQTCKEDGSGYYACGTDRGVLPPGEFDAPP
jgi:hypothetical protein